MGLWRESDSQICATFSLQNLTTFNHYSPELIQT